MLQTELFMVITMKMTAFKVLTLETQLLKRLPRRTHGKFQHVTQKARMYPKIIQLIGDGKLIMVPVMPNH